MTYFKPVQEILDGALLECGPLFESESEPLSDAREEWIAQQVAREILADSSIAPIMTIDGIGGVTGERGLELLAKCTAVAKKTTELRFFWNGIKGPDGKLKRCHYSAGTYTESSGIPEGTITIYARDYPGFDRLVWCTFPCKNDTDSQTDYFEKDTARVVPSHPLYAQVKAALDAGEAKFQAMLAAREVKYAKQKAAVVAMAAAPASARVN